MKNERGFTLIEVLVALALLGIIAVAFLGGIATASKAMIIADERATAESLARSQMEYIKEQDYSTAPWVYTVTSLQRSSSQKPSWWNIDNPPLLYNNYAGYSVEVKADDFDADGDGDIEVPGEDEDIRRITVTVIHNTNNDKEVIAIEDYKVER